MKTGTCSLCAILKISIVLHKSLMGIISGEQADESNRCFCHA